MAGLASEAFAGGASQPAAQAADCTCPARSPCVPPCLPVSASGFPTCVQELADWRARMGQQVEGYRADLTSLQASLSSEMGGLRDELAVVKARIRRQLDSNAEAIGAASAGSAGSTGGVAQPPPPQQQQGRRAGPPQAAAMQALA